MVVFVVLGINILMLVLKATNCVMVDFWSYNHFIFCAAICYYASGSAIIGLICGAICAIVTFKLADWTQPVVEEEFGLPAFPSPPPTASAGHLWLTAEQVTTHPRPEQAAG